CTVSWRPSECTPDCPSGQRERIVNPSALPSLVRIHHLALGDPCHKRGSSCISGKVAAAHCAVKGPWPPAAIGCPRVLGSFTHALGSGFDAEGVPVTPSNPHAEFTAAARACAEVLLRRYSTSFALACRLLAPATRPHVAAIYAWARVADEVLDGAMDDPAAARGLIAEARRRTHGAIARGLDPDPVTHAFADTARRFGIGARLVDPFYDSMEADVEIAVHSRESLGRYIHGSAEVIGEM